MKEDFTDEDGIKAAELEGEFASMNGWEAESDAENLLNGLGVDTEFHYKQMSELTGALKVKVLLAQALSLIHILPAGSGQEASGVCLSNYKIIPQELQEGRRSWYNKIHG